ncbi:hypothetical protein [Ilumatobacter sp.]|uniref:hypothetical protein n=1 Tax=Ilumatobacter sp. TaxID=1967498 RepID=UPI003B529B4D
MPRRPSPIAVALALAAVTSGAGCADGSGSGGGAGDVERFCEQVTTNRDALREPRLTSSDDIEPFLALYREIGESAPLVIEREWDQLVVNYETASTVVPGDAESEQIVIATALSSEGSAATVNRWLIENCDVDLGPVATIVPQE